MSSCLAQPTLLVSGLRRSGTTILFESFRTSQEVIALDEPFHPKLWSGVRENSKGTWTELTALWRHGPMDVVPDVQPIFPMQEAEAGMSQEQQEYLSNLLAQERPVVIDVVRHWNKQAALASAAPKTHLVLLVRSPVPWVLSHLIPSGGRGWRFDLGTRVRRATVLSRRGNYDNWQYETIIDDILCRGRSIFDDLPIDGHTLAQQPAYVKLLAFWWVANKKAYIDLKTHAPNRYDLILAEDFAVDPSSVIEYLATRSGVPTGGVDLSSVFGPKRDALHSCGVWQEAFTRLGLPHSLLPISNPDGTALRAAFEGTLS